MSWMEYLSTTYDNCLDSIGYADDEKQRPLLPVCHITTQAHVEIVIDGEGKFRRARVITDKRDSVTIIPTTEGSGSRSGSKPENHPLCDKLQYVSGDYLEYGGVVTSGFSKDPQEPYRNFVKTLTQWCESDFSHPSAHAVLKYVKKGSIIKDLIDHRILHVGSNGKFHSKKEVQREKNAKDIFSVVDPQENAFVRWIVENTESKESCTWRDKVLWESWINFYLKGKKDKSICLVVGDYQATTTNHPKYVRREGDGAKLISANDSNGFTFRGRFINDEQACGVGLETSHKAHYALMWLISRQGYVKGDLAIVAWATSGVPTPQPTADSYDLWEDLPSEQSAIVDTAQEAGIDLSKRIAGYSKKISSTERVVVMAMDSATTGRLAITYYRELTASEFLKKIDHWHESCSWQHNYKPVEALDEQTGKLTKKYVRFDGAPAPSDIAQAAYGSRDDKLRKATIARLLPCIVDGQPVPRDLVDSVVRRASNRIGTNGYDWSKTLSISCALFKKLKDGEEKYKMALEETRRTRDYLYGRLLAVADILEERALYKTKENRATNAARYMQQFSQHPLRTWNQIHSALAPYIVRLGGASYYKNLIAEIKCLFETDDFTSDKPLTGEYLLGYYCQRQKLIEKPSKPEIEEGQNNNVESEN